MDTNIWIEIFGYIGSVLVVVSMLMASVVKLRVINTIGSVISGTYALIIGSIPLMLMNACLLVINIYNLIKLFRPEKHYDLIECSPDDGYLNYFVTRYAEDIKSYFPNFSRNAMGDVAYLVCCNGSPAGVFLGSKKSDNAVDIVLDYTTPTYRDCSVANYLYAKLPKRGVSKLVFAQGEISTHTAYLKKMGFEKENGIYTKVLK